MSFTTCLVVMLGGAIGTFLRYGGALVMKPISGDLPIGTIVIIIAGSFLIGFFGTLTLASGRYPVPENARLFVMVGICGGFTTFSSFSLQTLDLVREGALVRATLNVVLSVLLCIAAVAIGHVAGAWLNGDQRAIAQITLEEEG